MDLWSFDPRLLCMGPHKSLGTRPGFLMLDCLPATSYTWCRNQEGSVNAGTNLTELLMWQGRYMIQKKINRCCEQHCEYTKLRGWSHSTQNRKTWLNTGWRFDIFQLTAKTWPLDDWPRACRPVHSSWVEEKHKVLKHSLRPNNLHEIVFATY